MVKLVFFLGLSKETLASFGSTFDMSRGISKRKGHDRLNSNLDTLKEETEDRSYLQTNSVLIILPI